jgi:predicted patatin/cPLA2 family phospholipase
VETKETTVHATKSDGTNIRFGVFKARNQKRGSCNWVIRKSDGASEHVRASTGQNSKSSIRASDACGDLVQGSVTTKGNHEIDTTVGGVLGVSGGVAATICLDYLDIMLPR